MMINIGPADLMLARRAKPFTAGDWIFELKYDGFRIIAQKVPEGVRLVARDGRNVTTWFPALVRQLRDLKGHFVLDTKVCRVGRDGVPDLEGLRAAVRRRDEAGIALFAFDLIAIGRRDLREAPLLERKERLRRLFTIRGDRLRFVDHVELQGEALFSHACSIGMEGVVAKRTASPYVAGRSPDWLKLTRDRSQEGAIASASLPSWWISPADRAAPDAA